MKNRIQTLWLALAALLASGALHAAPSTSAPSYWLPPVVSPSGRLTDHLYLVILVIISVIFVITEGLLLYSVIVFREKPGRRAQFFHGSTAIELLLAGIPSAILLYLSVVSGKMWADLKLHRPAGKDVVHVQVFAEQFAWNFRYAGPDAAFGTADDIVSFNEMGMPLDKTVFVHMSSKDVIHSFFLPEPRVKQDVVPGLHTRAWFEIDHAALWDLKAQQRVLLTASELKGKEIAVSGYKLTSKPAARKRPYQASASEKIGYVDYAYVRDPEQPLKVVRDGQPVAGAREPQYVQHYYEIGCAQLCGTSHFAMRGTVKALPGAEFEAWLRAQQPDSFLTDKWSKIWDKHYPQFNRL